MALWFELKVNSHSIGTFEAIRKEGTTDPDSIGTYNVHIWNEKDERTMVRVQHRYGDGA